MNAAPLAVVVLAAGQGKRMRAPGPKVLLPACGRALVEWVLDAVEPLRPRRTVVVHGHGGDAVRAALAPRGVAFAHQSEQLGTGHAVQCALPGLGHGDAPDGDVLVGDVLVVCGDTPLLTPEVLAGLVERHREGGCALTVLSADVDPPGSLGRILRGPDGRLRAIREAADATESEREVREINTGVILVRGALLPESLARLGKDNAQGELYLTDLPAILLAGGHRVDAWKAPDASAALGVNNPLELAEAVGILRRRARERLLRAGVRLEDPETTVVDADVEIAPGTEVGPLVSVGTGARIAAGCRIGPHVRIGPRARVGEGAVLGAGAVLEGGAVVAAGARVAAGAVVESSERANPGAKSTDRGNDDA